MICYAKTTSESVACRGISTLPGRSVCGWESMTKRTNASSVFGWGSFKEATEQIGHHWHAIDFTDAFANWLCSPPYSDYAESYFESPARLGAAPMAAFKKSVAEQLRQALQAVESADNTVVALYGVASLFGFVRISEILPMFEDAIRGRLLVFFPGVYEQDNYRLLDARDGWNYHAVPITASEGEVRK